MKRIVVCCDGTWNRLDAQNPTNVVKLAETVLPTATDGTTRLVYYDEGVGSRASGFSSKANRILAGAFGWGMMENVEQAYRFLVFNFEPGDEIFHSWLLARRVYSAFAGWADSQLRYCCSE